MSRYEINMPNRTACKINKLKEFFTEDSEASIIALSVEILHWIVQQHEEGFEINAEKTTEDEIIIRGIPLRIIQEQNNKRKQ